MVKGIFLNFIQKNEEIIQRIRQSAHELHASVNQFYDGKRPYGFHLDMVAAITRQYGHLVCQHEEDILPMIFGAYYHDSIEDARLTYNDVKHAAEQYMNSEQALMAAEIAYALTNDKGRTRAERAGEKYYAGIRETPYAPFMKMADRMANITYSCSKTGNTNPRMKGVYQKELPHFLESINPHSDDLRFDVPKVMTEKVEALFNS